jgi:hypothetical protein
MEAGNGEALGPHWSARPLQVRRLIAPGAAKAEIGRQNEVVRQVVAVLETVARDSELSHVRPPFIGTNPSRPPCQPKDFTATPDSPGKFHYPSPPISASLRLPRANNAAAITSMRDFAHHD